MIKSNLGAARMFVRKGTSVLMVHSLAFYPNPSPWEISGGGVKKKRNESGEQAAIRECEEETGCVCTEVKHRFNVVYNEGEISEWHVAVFEAIKFTEPPVLTFDPEELDGVDWIEESALQALWISEESQLILGGFGLLPAPPEMQHRGVLYPV